MHTSVRGREGVGALQTLPCDVEADKRPHSPSIELWAEYSEALIAGCVPQLRLHQLAINLQGPKGCCR